jgi:SAM-dependent methyltransferase
MSRNSNLLLNLIGVFLFQTIPNICFSQFDSVSFNQKIIIAHTELRDEIFSEPIKLAKFRALQQKWEENGIDTLVQKKFVGFIFYYSKIREFSYEIALTKFKSYPKYIKILLHFTKDDFQTVLENYRLAEYITEYIVKYKYPYELINFKNFQEEHFFYQLKDSLRIAEIGAGSGTFSYLLSKIHVGMTLYVNELDKGYVNYIKQINKSNKQNSSNVITAFQGTYYSIGLNELNLDKVIIRNSFHHFKKPRKMLRSIKLALKPKGELYLYELVPPMDKEDWRCKEVMKTEKIIKKCKKSGFILVEEKMVGTDKILLKFVVK